MLRLANEKVIRELKIKNENIEATFKMRSISIGEKNGIIASLREKNIQLKAEEGKSILDSWYESISIIEPYIVLISEYPKEKPGDILRKIEYHQDIIFIINRIVQFCSLEEFELKNSESSQDLSSPSPGGEETVGMTVEVEKDHVSATQLMEQ